MGRPERHPGHRGRVVPHTGRGRPDLSDPISPGARPSPNIWNSPETYEIENRAVDRAGRLAALLRSLASWEGRHVLDVGCGTGFHLPWFAETAATVTGVEPHPALADIARRRTRRLPNVTVLQGTAEELPVRSGSVDVAHARWAYFFGPGCEPGLAELDRVVRRGGTALVVDNDASRSTFGSWFRRGFPSVDPDEVDRFWSVQGWSTERLEIAWTFDRREDLEAVVRIELPTQVADQVLAEHPGITEVDYAVNVRWRRF
ncbi:MAG TPA: class I SAM-dependent methyltransferase [Marmoricola sp.]|nr:class I SAM-dependent methyltransferase [Marmoricola sp.]